MEKVGGRNWCVGNINGENDCLTSGELKSIMSQLLLLAIDSFGELSCRSMAYGVDLFDNMRSVI